MFDYRHLAALSVLAILLLAPPPAQSSTGIGGPSAGHSRRGHLHRRPSLATRSAALHRGVTPGAGTAAIQPFGSEVSLAELYLLVLAAGAVAAVERGKRRGRIVSPLSADYLPPWFPTASRARAGRAPFDSVDPLPWSLRGIRWLLLFGLCLPAAASWRGFGQSGNGNLLPMALVAAATLASIGLLARRLARSGAAALSVCAGTGLVSLLLANRGLPTAPENGNWASGLLLSGAHAAAAAFGGAGFTVAASGYAVGYALIFATALAAGTGGARYLFETPQLEHRAVNPLEAPLSEESRLQLRVLFLYAVVAIALATASPPNRPLPIVELALAGALQVWGWRNRQLRFRQCLGAIIGAAFVSLALWWIFSTAANFGALLALKANIIPTTGAAHIVAKALQVLLAGGFSGRVPVIIACAAVLGGAYATLQQPPELLAVSLALAPAWGWLLIGGSCAALFAAFWPGGALVATGAMLTLLPAFLFVWLERIEIL